MHMKEQLDPRDRSLQVSMPDSRQADDEVFVMLGGTAHPGEDRRSRSDETR